MYKSIKISILLAVLMLICINSASAVGISNGIVTDTNEFEYSYVGDGIYSISSDTTISQFGFAISGNYNGQPIIRSFNDLTWNNPVKTNIPDGFKYNIIDASGNWDTQFAFTDDYTKIQNTITNPYPNDITNAKFWYVMTVDQGDEIKIATKKYTVTSNSNIHITDSQYNLNTLTQKMRVNNIQLNYADLIENNFRITDLYLTDGDVLGYPNQKTIAVGFTKGDSVFASGSTIVIDPTIENGLDAITTYTGTDVIGNFTLIFNEVNANEVNITISNLTGTADEWNKYKTITLTNPPTIDNYQVRLNVTYDPDMQSDFDDLRFEDSNNTLNHNIISYVASGYAIVDVLIENQESSITMNYANSLAPDASNPEHVYDFWDGFEGSSLNTSKWTLDWSHSSGGTVAVANSNISLKSANSVSGISIKSDVTFTKPYVIESKAWIEDNVNTFGMYETTNTNPTDAADISSAFKSSGGNIETVNGDGTNYEIDTVISGGATGVEHDYRTVVDNDGKPTFYIDESLVDSEKTYAYTSNTMIRFMSYIETEEMYSDWILVRKYLATEPTAAFGSEQSYTGIPGNITVSVTGDSYVFTDNGSTTLIPTAKISSVNFTANSTTQYDYNVTLYWTEEFIIYTETIANGYANYSVSYTPSENSTSGTINATYSQIDFSAHDYIGTMSVTLDGLPVSATRTDETVSIPVTNLNTSTHSISISIPYNPQPTMIYPNGQTLSFSFPPLNHDIPANWSTTTGIYRYTVTTQGGVFVAQDTITTNSTTFSLPAGDYFWYVQGYDDIFDEYSSSTNVFNFTVENDYDILNITAIVGVVYNQEGQTKTPITNAVVTITNDTWSDSIVVGADGFYSFVDLTGNETYFLAASAEYYDDSGTIIVTTDTNHVTQRDILLTSTTTDYVPHYVKFTVKDIFRNKYSDVAVSVYKGLTPEGVAFRTGTTGDDGSVTFRLDQNTQYTLTFIKIADGIDETLTLYPQENNYNVYVGPQSLEPDDDYSSEEIDITVSKELINNTHAYINVTYLDNLNETTGLNIYLNQSTTNNLFNQTVIDSYSGVSNSTTVSFVVEDYAGQTYFINIDIDHVTFGDVQRSYAVNFDGMEDAHGFSQVYIWLAIGGIMFSGMIFKATNARQGAFVVCVVAWVFIILGWFDNLGDKGVLAITAGVTLATILSIAAIMAKGEKEG